MKYIVHEKNTQNVFNLIVIFTVVFLYTYVWLLNYLNL